GPCIGGTLSLLAALVGTPYQPDFAGAVLFFEDVHENPARVQRYLTQLLFAGILEASNGFLIGDTAWEATPEEAARCLTAEQVFRDLLEPLGKPAIAGFPCGHVANPIPLPQGVTISLDADRRRVEVLEAAVR